MKNHPYFNMFGLMLAIGMTVSYCAQAGQLLSMQYSGSLYPTISIQITNQNTVTTNFPIYFYEGQYWVMNNHAVTVSLAQSGIQINSLYGEDPTIACESKQDLWAYNQSGQTGPITVTITPQFNYNYPDRHCAFYFDLHTSLNAQPWDERICNALSSFIYTNNLAPFNLIVTNGDQITFDLVHQAGYGNSAGGMSLSSTAKYTINVSANGYVTATMTQPTISSTSINHSRTQLTVAGTGGPKTATNYFVLTTTNLALPVNSWTISQTNTFDTSGGFNFTLPITTDKSQCYLQIKSAP